MRKIYFSFLTACALLLTAVNTSAQCLQNFDGVVAPALPAGWTAVTNVPGAGSLAWATSTGASFNAPNSIFTNNPTVVSDEWINSESFPINSAAAVLTFNNSFNLENTFDGMVLEISIGGGAFQDILAAGGAFVTGGYNGTISVNFSSPIAGRQAWTGNSGGFIVTTVNLPAAANGQNIVLRWRRATDTSFGNTGANVDNIFIVGSACACTAPTIGTNPANQTSCAGGNTSFSVGATGSFLAYQWQVNSGSGFTNIANAAPYSGATTATLLITGTPIALNGNQYRAVVTGACGSATSNAGTLTLNQTVHSVTAATPVIMCAPGATVITGTASGTATGGNVTLATSGTINLAIPDNTPAGANSTLALTSSLPTAADLKLRLNMRHSWVGDLRITLTSPCGTTLVFDRPGVPATGAGNNDNLGAGTGTTPPPAVYVFDIAGATIIPETPVGGGFIPAGTYKPSDASNPGFGHNWAGITFPCGAGNWTLNISDNASGDQGLLVDWAILRANTYTHTLTGPGTIVQNPASGPNNANASFNVTNIPAGNQNYVLTSTDAAGCQAVSNVAVVVNAVPVITFTQTPNPVCNGSVQTITASATPPVPQLVTGGGAITINPVGNATPYSSDIIVGGLPAGTTVKSVTINGLSHTFPGDIDMLLQSPAGGNVILMSDAGGGNVISGVNLTFDDAGATVLPGTIVSGTYKPTNTGGPDVFPNPGPGSITQVAPTLASMPASDFNGAWKLFVVDDAGGDGGAITSWSITFNIPVPVTYSPLAGLFTDLAGTIAYTGTPVYGNVYAKVAANTTYTASATRNGCTGTANVTVTVNQLPAITTQPAPATQTVCPGSTVNYSVVATGAGLTYQWRKGGVALTNGLQLNGTTVSGATTNALSLAIVSATDAGNYDVVVSGTCTPSVTSTAAALVIASAPTITTQPANVTTCIGGNATFSVVATGVPTPAIYQWQVSTTAVPAFTPIDPVAVPSAITSTLTLTNVTASMSGNKYRVVITNTCSQSVTSNGNATLTVNATPAVTATALPARICLSDGPIALVGSPAGGSWTGIGVSGSNFIPGATAVGNYTLTYTYTNALGCPATATVVARVVSDAECGRIRLLRDNALILYPNPNDGKFNVRVNSVLYNYVNMKVYTASGNLVTTKSYSGLVYGQVVPIDLSHLPSGTYMVRFFYDDGARTAEKVFPVIIGRQ